jgi:tyrosinase
MSDDTTSPVADPTWYGNIRQMFNAKDIAHMAPQGLDLTSYDQVVASAGSIYGQVAAGNMPPPPDAPWSQDMVQTFLNWMTNGTPKGTPTTDQVAQTFTAAAAQSTATRVRADIDTLSPAQLDLLKQAFEGIMAKDPSDPNSYFVQAGYHWLPAPLYCLHHVPGYNPWHRAYMLNFENALRSVPGCEQVTLPYWDITKPFPEVLKAPPFDSYTLPQDIGEGYNMGYVTQRYSYPTIQQNLLTFSVVEDLERALTKTDWEDFHGYWSGAPYNTIIAAHDGGHGSIGPTMADQSVAAYDPVFWFFHANWDRLWWEWQKKMGATNLNGLLSTINKATDLNSYNIFTVPVLQALAPFTTLPINLNSVTVIDSVNSLDVDYTSPEIQPGVLASAPKTSRSAPVDRGVSINPQRATVTVDGVNRLSIPGSFAVHLFKDGQRVASRFLFQPNEPDKCETCVQNAIAHFDFDLPLEEVSGGELHVEVEPVNTNFVGPRFPSKLMGQPRISVHIPVQTR